MHAQVIGTTPACAALGLACTSTARKSAGFTNRGADTRPFGAGLESGVSIASLMTGTRPTREAVAKRNFSSGNDMNEGGGAARGATPPSSSCAHMTQLIRALVCSSLISKYACPDKAVLIRPITHRTCSMLLQTSLRELGLYSRGEFLHCQRTFHFRDTTKTHNTATLSCG